ncbi:MAG TPA: tRNA glutamyl-Q(34) synthetase GluQRS [Caproiciproducens sp.]|nr:tRNA glutamyl-Q(34) synthetase GluQRS [Caproiciproducens sp.]
MILQNKNSGVCGRFAPSPSGRMHLGNVFCALIAWLSVRSAGGKMVLRIEDLDPGRCRPEYAAQLQDDLLWLGLDWDEGGMGQGRSYMQSRRSGIYQQYYDILEEKGLLYPCFCSRTELHAVEAPHRSDGRYVYSGRCRNLSGEEVARLSAERKPAVRIVTPDKTETFTDGNLGPYSQNLRREFGDFIVRRSDGVFSYQLAVVVDDALMGITEVTRGRDLQDSTPCQRYLFKQFGFSPPSYYHIPLLLAPDGRRLSKREHDLDLGCLRERYRPEQILGYLAHICGLIDRPEPVGAKELVPRFSWDHFPKDDITISGIIKDENT